jgi:hypothetical protein
MENDQPVQIGTYPTSSSVSSTRVDQAPSQGSSIEITIGPSKPATITDRFSLFVTSANLLAYASLDYLAHNSVTTDAIAQHPFTTLSNAGFGIVWRVVAYGFCYGLSLSFIPHWMRMDDILGNGALGVANWYVLKQVSPATADQITGYLF